MLNISFKSIAYFFLPSFTWDWICRMSRRLLNSSRSVKTISFALRSLCFLPYSDIIPDFVAILKGANHMLLWQWGAPYQQHMSLVRYSKSPAFKYFPNSITDRISPLSTRISLRRLIAATFVSPGHWDRNRRSRQFPVPLWLSRSRSICGHLPEQ